MSKGIAEPKLTAADAMLDKLTTTIFIFQIVVVLILGVAGNIWNNYEKRKVRTNDVVLFPVHLRPSVVFLLHEFSNITTFQVENLHNL